MIFYLHGRGVGSEWAENLQVGDQMKLMGPGGRFKMNADARHHLFFGDESSLGLYHHLKEIANAVEYEYLCLLELDPEHTDWPDRLGIRADIVPKADGAAANWLTGLDRQIWQVWRSAKPFFDSTKSICYQIDNIHLIHHHCKYVVSTKGFFFKLLAKNHHIFKKAGKKSHAKHIPAIALGFINMCRCSHQANKPSRKTITL